MSALQQASTAQNRNLSEWYHMIQAGQIKLPRFQRFEAWDKWRVQGFLDTIAKNLPVGITLLLQVGDTEKFVSRYISTAPETGAHVTEHLLDGQQRLTALWRALHNNYESTTYFLYYPEFDAREGVEEEEGDRGGVRQQPRWEHRGKRRPLWADEPAGCLARGRIPLELFRPESIDAEINQWISEATAADEPDDSAPDALQKYKALTARRDRLRSIIIEMRERVAHFNLPYLALPVTTEADMALQVFINMNTNSKPLSMYDLTVAKVEGETGQSLHDQQEHLETTYPLVTNYGDLSWPILQAAALMQGKAPTRAGVADTDKTKLVDDWAQVEVAASRAANFLVQQRIYDAPRLPTSIVFPVLTALFSQVPESGDLSGRAMRLLRAYAWTSFFTNCYEGAANTKALQDYRRLGQLLVADPARPVDLAHVPAMDRVEYPLPTYEQLVRVGWPKSSDRTARAVLVATLYFGGWDFADGQPASFESLKYREYHHVFPDALLHDAGIDGNLALNCALITWKTNRSIGRKDPLEYIRDRVHWAPEADVKQRLATHLLDYGELAAAHYIDATGDVLTGDKLRVRLRPDFERFLQRRAKSVAYMAEELADGRIPVMADVLAKADEAVIVTAEQAAVLEAAA